MPNLFVFAHLPFANNEVREEVRLLHQALASRIHPPQAQEKLARISDHAKQNEPETLRYFFSAPREESDVKSIYVIEE